LAGQNLAGQNLAGQEMAGRESERQGVERTCEFLGTNEAACCECAVPYIREDFMQGARLHAAAT
jgi:hypothetical protein